MSDLGNVRVRFAPSPTGYLHVGGVRTAIFNYLFARKHGGTFVLRIDDTDIKRHHDEAVEVILNGMKWVGMEWDEGPGKGGAYGPYYQSERFDRYREVAEQLEKSGRAYWAKKEAPKELPAWKVEKLKKAGKWDEERAEAATDPEPALYFKIHPGEPQDVVFQDAVWKEYRRPAELVDDYVILRSNKVPTYNFATVVDDIDMKISHVIRGEDHLANTPKQIRLFEALGAPLPVFAHLPMIHNDKGQKISKRRDPVAVTLYKDCGVLPEALFNFLTLLGWSPGDDRELLTKEEMIEAFSLDRIKLAPAQFHLNRKQDMAPDAEPGAAVAWLLEALPGTKLEWMNGEYLKKLAPADLAVRAKPFLEKRYDLSGVPAERIQAALKIEQERARTLASLAQNVGMFFAAPKELAPKAVQKVLLKNDGLVRLKEAREVLAAQGDWSAQALESVLAAHVEKNALKFGHVAQPIRVALSGDTVSPPIHDTLHVLGKDESLRRIDAVFAKNLA